MADVFGEGRHLAEGDVDLGQAVAVSDGRREGRNFGHGQIQRFEGADAADGFRDGFDGCVVDDQVLQLPKLPDVRGQFFNGGSFDVEGLQRAVVEMWGQHGNRVVLDHEFLQPFALVESSREG